MIIERELDTKQVGVDNDLQFVDLTICPGYQAAYKNKIFNEYGLDKENYRRKGVYFPSKYDKHRDFSKLFDHLTYDVDEILKQVTIYTSSERSPQFTINFDSKN